MNENFSCLWEVTIEAYIHLLVIVDFYICSNLLLRILTVARVGQGTPAFLDRWETKFTIC